MRRVILPLLLGMLSAAGQPFSTAVPSQWRITTSGITNGIPRGGAVFGSTSNDAIIPYPSGYPLTQFFAFNGWWEATFEFYVPLTVQNATLICSNLYADDRAVMFLNDDPVFSLGNWCNDTSTNSTRFEGQMVLTNNGAAVPYTFSNLVMPSYITPNFPSLAVTNGFLLGRTNVIRFVINNTTNDEGILGVLGGICGTNIPDNAIAGDPTVLRAFGVISFDPPPLSIALYAKTNMVISCPYTTGRYYLQHSSNLLNWTGAYQMGWCTYYNPGPQTGEWNSVTVSVVNVSTPCTFWRLLR